MHATLYHTMGVPQYARYIYEYLTKATIREQPNAKKRMLILEAQQYQVLGNQLYKIGPDGNLRLCSKSLY